MVVISNVPPAEEGLKLKQELVTAVVSGKNKGVGTLFISESRVFWQKDAEDESFSLEYRHIAVHAISRDLNAFPNECLYLLLDVKLAEDEEAKESDDDEDEEDEVMTEVRFVPEDTEALDSMYEAMKECQALHPDPELSDEEEEDDDEEGYYDAATGEGNDHTNGTTQEGNDVDMEEDYADAEPDH